MADKIKTLYICYFGLSEPLVQTQVLPYLLEMVKGGIEVSLLTFEPAAPVDDDAEREALRALGIDWHSLRYHKRPSVPATFFDILNGARFVRKLLDRKGFNVLHCRVHVPASMAVLARRFSRRKPKIIFDIRGFFPEEYTDAGIWPEDGWLFRTAKRVEKFLLRESDGFVVLTEKAREILFPESADAGFDQLGRPVEVIPCCVDLSRFDFDSDAARREMRSRLGIGEQFVLVYVGSFGGWYLSDEMFDLFAAAREVDPNIFIIILTHRQTQNALEHLKAKGFDDDSFFVAGVTPNDLPGYLVAADAAVSLVKPCYSKLASSPTKNAEYLAAGLPIIANPGIGDVDNLIEENGVGILLPAFNRDSYIAAFEGIAAMRDAAEKCREVARENFDRETIGGVRYRRLYERLFCKRPD